MAGVLVAHRKHRAGEVGKCWDQLTQVHSEFRSSFILRPWEGCLCGAGLAKLEGVVMCAVWIYLSYPPQGIFSIFRGSPRYYNSLLRILGSCEGSSSDNLFKLMFLGRTSTRNSYVCHFADITPTLFKVSSIDPSTLFFFGKGVLDSFFAFSYEF